jgi:hypothetical protein
MFFPFGQGFRGLRVGQGDAQPQSKTRSFYISITSDWKSIDPSSTQVANHTEKQCESMKFQLATLPFPWKYTYMYACILNTMKADKGSIMPWLSLKGRAEDYSNEHIGSIINKNLAPYKAQERAPKLEWRNCWGQPACRNSIQVPAILKDYISHVLAM